jgi:hypothetical protein
MQNQKEIGKKKKKKRKKGKKRVKTLLNFVLELN